MNETPRVAALVSELAPCASLADVGCDHGYATAYALRSGLCGRAYACDVSAASLKKAETLLQEEIAAGRCVPVCTDGLDGVSDADCVQALCAYLHKSLAAAVAKRAGTEGKARDNAAILARTLKNYTLGFDGVCDIKNAQVVCGGLELTDFDPRTMESTKVKGLYATGEALDVDGECGGYNLHWAWASAYAAARAIAGEINV